MAVKIPGQGRYNTVSKTAAKPSSDETVRDLSTLRRPRFSQVIAGKENRDAKKPGLKGKKSVSGCRFPGRPNTRLSGEATERWGVHRYGNFACPQIVVASRPASPPTFPAFRKPSGQASDNCYPFPRHRGPSSSMFRTHRILAAGSKRCAFYPSGVLPRECRASFERSTRALSIP